jgi:hypothetical protein
MVEHPIFRHYQPIHFHRHQSARDAEMNINPSDIHVHLHLEPDREVLARLDVVLQKLDLMETKIMTTQSDIAAALAQVQTDVAAQTTVTASLQSYVQGIVAQLAALASQTTDTTTAAALTALSTQIQANSAADAALIVQNTPAATA